MSESRSVYDRRFTIRISILLLLLGAAIFGLYKDGESTRNANRKINELMDTLTRFEGGNGLTHAEVRHEFGFEPTDKKTAGQFEVERFVFNRLLPFSKGQFIDVAYFKGNVYQAMVNREFDPAKSRSGLMAGIKTVPVGERTMPVASIAGGGGGGASRDAGEIVNRIMRGDRDGDGKLNTDEVSAQMLERFELMDDDGDGYLSRAEIDKTIRDRAHPQAAARPDESTDRDSQDTGKPGETNTNTGNLNVDESKKTSGDNSGG